jgi:hypothetical protein
MRIALFVVVVAAALACGPSSSQQQTTTPPPADAATEPAAEAGTPPPPPAATYDMVTLAATPYYGDSPMQARPPDGEIPAGTPCRVLDGGIGPYAHIETATGINGYVGADAIGPNTP